MTEQSEPVNNKFFSQESRMSLYLVLWRLPDLIASLFAAIVSGSMVTWMEFVECSSIIVPGIIIFFLTKMLKKNLKLRDI